MSKPYKRRRYLIDRRFQGRFILRFFALSCLASVLAVLLFNFLAYRKMDSVLYSMTMPFSGPGDILFTEIVLANVYALLFIAAAFLLTTKRMYARIKHPLRKIHGELGRIAGGDLRTKITLRERDEFRDFADRLNDMAAALRERVAALDREVEGISESLAAAQRDGAAADLLMQRVNALAGRLKELKK